MQRIKNHQMALVILYDYQKGMSPTLAIDFQGNMKASCQYYASLKSLGTDLQFFALFWLKTLFFFDIMTIAILILFYIRDHNLFLSS